MASILVLSLAEMPFVQTRWEPITSLPVIRTDVALRWSRRAAHGWRAPLSLGISLLGHTVALAYFGWVAASAGVHYVPVQSGRASVDLQASMASAETPKSAETEPLAMAIKSKQRHECELAVAARLADDLSLRVSPREIPVAVVEVSATRVLPAALLDVDLPPAPADVAPRVDPARADVPRTTGDASPRTERRDMGRHRLAELTGEKASLPSRASKASRGAELPTVAVHNPAPAYPSDALEARLTGRVEIWATVDAEGKVREAGIYRSSGIQSLDAAALEAVRSWRFSRAKSQGRAIRKLVLPINFTIDES